MHPNQQSGEGVARRLSTGGGVSCSCTLQQDEEGRDDLAGQPPFAQFSVGTSRLSSSDQFTIT